MKLPVLFRVVQYYKSNTYSILMLLIVLKIQCLLPIEKKCFYLE